MSADLRSLQVAAFLSRKTARHGAYQEYTIASAPQTFHVSRYDGFSPLVPAPQPLTLPPHLQIPPYLTHEEASTIPLAYSTAVGGIFGDLHVPIPPRGASLPLPLNAETPILVWGGASSVGAYAIQLAKLSGYRVITTAGPANFDYVKSLGADIVIDYKDGEKAVEEIKKASGGKLRLVVECVYPLLSGQSGDYPCVFLTTTWAVAVPSRSTAQPRSLLVRSVLKEGSSALFSRSTSPGKEVGLTSKLSARELASSTSA